MAPSSFREELVPTSGGPPEAFDIGADVTPEVLDQAIEGRSNQSTSTLSWCGKPAKASSRSMRRSGGE